MEWLSVFFISVPIFYIIGVIAFLRFLFGKKQVTREEFLQTAIKDLERTVAKTPLRTIEKQLAVYQAELAKYTVANVNPSAPFAASDSLENDAQPISPAQNLYTAQERKSEPTPQKAAVDLGVVWANWYSDNSINVLLYMGAFLIVASASIFVGFSWTELNGQIKAITLTLLTIGFFVSGGIFL